MSWRGLLAVFSLLPPLAEAHLGAGDAEAARSYALEVIESGGRGQGMNRWPELAARVVLARARLRLEGPVAAVEDELLRAEALGREIGNRSVAAQVEEARAELAAATSNDAGRTEHLREAERIYTEFGATGHAERVARELES